MVPQINSLNVIDVAAPCPADWNAMTGDERVRHCAQCDMNVYNLSEMTKDESLRLINEREGRLCVQFYRRADGTVITRDCPVGLRAIRQAVQRNLVRMWAKAVALSTALFVNGLFGRNAKADRPLIERPIPGPEAVLIRGDVCVVAPGPIPVLTIDGLKMTPPQTIKQYLHRCLAKEEQASYGMPDPDNKNALEEGVRQAWQAKVHDASFLPQPGSEEHTALATITAELLKKHPDVAQQVAARHLPRHIEEVHELRLGRIMIRPDRPLELPKAE